MQESGKGRHPMFAHGSSRQFCNQVGYTSPVQAVLHNNTGFSIFKCPNTDFANILSNNFLHSKNSPTYCLLQYCFRVSIPVETLARSGDPIQGSSGSPVELVNLAAVGFQLPTIFQVPWTKGHNVGVWFRFIGSTTGKAGVIFS